MKTFPIVLMLLMTIQFCPAQVGEDRSNPTTTPGLTEQTGQELEHQEGALPVDVRTTQTSEWFSRVIFLVAMLSVAMSVVVWMHRTRMGFWTR